jgi:hypothetical protein
LTYRLDTSGLLDGWVRYYSPDVFPSLWKQMETAVAERKIPRQADIGDARKC